MLISRKLSSLREKIASEDYDSASQIVSELNGCHLSASAEALFSALKKQCQLVFEGLSEDIYRNGVNLGSQLEHFYGNHRSGWAYAVNALRPISDESGIYLDTFIERTFSWSPEGVRPILRPWIGVIHVPPNVPKWFQYEQSNESIFETEAWKQSLPYCQGLITLSEYHKKHLEQKFDFPIINLFHPTEEADVRWSWERFSCNKEKKIIQIGWYLRKLHAIYQLPESIFKKIHLKVTDQQYFTNLMDTEREILIRNGEFSDEMYKSTQVVGFLSNEEYDHWLSENIAFVHLYDASANNAVIECIARGTPLLVNPLPAVIEYLGKDYPFYYESYDEAIEKASDFELVKKTNIYLNNLPNRKKLSGAYFCKSLRDSVLVNDPVISIVTVVYNDKEALQETIESVIAQDYLNVEYIVIDGGSTDGTKDLLEKYDEHITYWISEPDRGIYDAMNKGAKLAKGTWVNFLNAGDTFYNSGILQCVAENIDHNADLVYGNTYFDNGVSKELKKAEEPNKLWMALNFNHNALFAKRDLLLEHPFCDEYKIVADSEFVIWSYAQQKRFQHIDIVINNYKCGGFSDVNSIMRTVERWKLVSEYKMMPQEEINNYYFQRLLWEKDCQKYLLDSYGCKVG